MTAKTITIDLSDHFFGAEAEYTYTATWVDADPVTGDQPGWFIDSGEITRAWIGKLELDRSQLIEALTHDRFDGAQQVKVIEQLAEEDATAAEDGAAEAAMLDRLAVRGAA